MEMSTLEALAFRGGNRHVMHHIRCLFVLQRTIVSQEEDEKE